jgi:two-component system, OmpR family, sensor histidine kinase CiaH
MPDDSKRKLRLTTILYWILLVYIVTALIWWFFSLYTENEESYLLKLKYLNETVSTNDPAYQPQLAKIEKQRTANRAKYIGEGVTFFALLMIGAVYLYRSVRQQFRVQQQQRNFVMAISHELKTPLAVARLNLETIQRYKLEEPKKEKLLQMTLQETLRLDDLINNILVSSQLDGQSYSLSKEELNFSALVNDAFCQFAARYHERILIKHLQQDIDFEGDALLLKLLVSNLLENANKYSTRDRPITIDLQKKNNHIQLVVKDEGSGISEEEKKNVFKKFYRVGNEETRKTKGTGLGLYLCKKIAADHNGTITIEDNQPQGSKFIVTFST